MLSVRHLSVSYGSVPVLWDVSLEIAAGEIVALLGANGAGKTTTLNTISGILRPSAGSIHYMAQPLNGLSPDRVVERGISQVPEGRLIFQTMTVVENLELGAFASRARKKLRTNLERVYEIFPVLKARAGQVAGSLSGGQQQMLAIGRALMSSPSLLLLDEPSLGLAPKLVAEMFDIIVALREQHQVTILLVEQDTRHALEVATRGYVLESGKIALEGKGRDLLDNDHVRRAYLGL